MNDPAVLPVAGSADPRAQGAVRHPGGQVSRPWRLAGRAHQQAEFLRSSAQGHAAICFEKFHESMHFALYRAVTYS